MPASPDGLTQWEDWRALARAQEADAIHTTWFERPSGDQPEIWCYTDSITYQAGEPVHLYVHTTAPRFGVAVTRDGANRQVVYRQSSIRGHCQQTPADAFSAGCQWASPVTIPAGGDWRSGGYVVSVVTEGISPQRQAHHWFAIRPRPGRGAGRLLLIAATATWNCYNDWGGASAYEGIAGSSHDQLSPVLSQLRPFARGQIWRPAGAPRFSDTTPMPPGAIPRSPAIEWAYANGYSKYYAAAGWAGYERLFVSWAEHRGYAVDIITQTDLHQRPDLLESYPCVLTAGHDEYWSWQMRDAIDHHVDQGGAFARFGGNIFWQIRLSEDAQTQTCYKYLAGAEDPVRNGASKHLVTSCWEDPLVGRPAATTFGASGPYGGYAGFGGWSPRASGGFTAYRPSNWVFDSCDLYFGDVFGATAGIARYEVDGLDYTMRHGLPCATGANGVDPERVEILAMCPAGLVEEDHANPGASIFVGDGDARFVARMLLGSDTPANIEKVAYGAGTMVLCKRGLGEVFNAAAVEWVNGLASHDPIVGQVTQNVINNYLRRRESR
jgi:hypothetical protein